jgi:hypothetical protein
MAAALGVALGGCSQSSNGVETTHVSQSDLGQAWPFTGITEGTITCDPAAPVKALFHVTGTSGSGSQHKGETWAINGDGRYPLPPHDVWTGAVSVLAKYAPASCSS